MPLSTCKGITYITFAGILQINIDFFEAYRFFALFPESIRLQPSAVRILWKIVFLERLEVLALFLDAMKKSLFFLAFFNPDSIIIILTSQSINFYYDKDYYLF